MSTSTCGASGRCAASVRTILVAALVLAGACQGTPPATEAKAPATAGRRAFWTTYTRAGQARAGGRLDEAIALYGEALRLRPDHEDSLYYLGHCLLERGAFDRALASYQRLVELNPAGSSRAHMQIGSIHASLDPTAPVDFAAAGASFRKALEVDPDSGALLGLAEVAVRDGQWDEADRLLARVEADNGMSIAAPYLRGYLAHARGRSDAAWTFFTTAVRRGDLRKPAVTWTEEGDVKGTPELRWRALARQSVFGPHWLRLRAYLKPPGPTRAAMTTEYAHLRRVLAGRAR